MVAVRLAAAQAALGAKVSVAAQFPPAAVAQIESQYSAVPGFAAVPRHPLPPFRRIDLLGGGALRAALQMVAENADILHLHGIWDPHIKLAADAADRAGVPYVITVHGMLDPGASAKLA